MAPITFVVIKGNLSSVRYNALAVSCRRRSVSVAANRRSPLRRFSMEMFSRSPGLACCVCGSRVVETIPRRKKCQPVRLVVNTVVVDLDQPERAPKEVDGEELDLHVARFGLREGGNRVVEFRFNVSTIRAVPRVGADVVSGGIKAMQYGNQPLLACFEEKRESNVLIAIGVFFTILIITLFVRIIMSWINPGGYNPIISLMVSLTDPMMRPARRILPPFSGLDLSPLIVFVVLQLCLMLLVQPLRHLGQIMLQ